MVRSDRRDALRAHLGAAGVACDVHYPVPDHLQPVWADSLKVRLAVTEEACRQVLSLPCFPGLTDAQVERVIGAVRQFHEGATCPS